MSHENAPVDPLLHDMEQVLEPAEGTNDNASNGPLKGDWSDLPAQEPGTEIPPNPDLPPTPPTPPPELPDRPAEAPDQPTGPDIVT